MDVLNIDCFKGPKAAQWLCKASGSLDIDGERALNGGILNPQREHLKLGQYYYRFVSRALRPEVKIGGAWWIDFDTLNNIHARYRQVGPSPTARQSSGPGAGARSTFREWLALTFEWNLIEEVVIAELRARLDSYSGFGRRAEGRHGFDNRAFGMAPHLSNLFTIKQHCVPEVWVYQRQAFPRFRIVGFQHIDDIVAGKIL
jgi:hypothetical protein